MRMKVLLVNGSPHKKGCTYTALTEVAKTLNEESIDTEIFWIGTKPLAGCTACMKCAEIGRCSFDDRVNDFLDMATDADGFIFGSPVHYAAASGAITSFMDRVFYADLLGGNQSFYLKPAAAVVSARRAGTTATFDQINKYFTISQMPIISSTLLEHGSWSKARRCEKRFGRIANHAHTCKEYGLVSKVQGSWCKSRHTTPREGRNHLHQFYQGIIIFFLNTISLNYDEFRIYF